MLREQLRQFEKRPKYSNDSTRRSLLVRLAQWEDSQSWQEFFDAYWRLIYAVAREAGLGDEDAQDVVQDTVVSVAKKIGGFDYNPKVASFKSWLLTLTRRRISDHFRKKARTIQGIRDDPDDGRATPVVDRIPDVRLSDLDAVWEKEWEHSVLDAALARLKRRCNPKMFAVFHLHVVKDQPASEVAGAIGVNIAQVYLSKHRVLTMLRKEIRALKQTLR